MKKNYDEYGQNKPKFEKLKYKIINFFNSKNIPKAFQFLSYLEENQKDNYDLFLKSISTIANNIDDIKIKLQFFEFNYKKNRFDTLLLTSYGDALAKNGEYQKAFEQFQKSLNIDGTNTIALTSYGDALAKNGEYQKAFIFFKKSLGIDNQNRITLFLYANALEQNGQYLDAIKQLESIKVRDISKSYKNFIFLYIGKLYFLIRDYRLAEESFKKINSDNLSQKNILTRIIQELISDKVNSHNIIKNLASFIEGFDKSDLDSISHIFLIDELSKIYDDENLKSKLQEERELNITIFHKLENHLSLIRLTFDFIIHTSKLDNIKKIAGELRDNISEIFIKIKSMREEQKNLDKQIGKLSLKEIEKKLIEIGEDIADKINNKLSFLKGEIDFFQTTQLIEDNSFEESKKQLLTAMAIANNLRILNKSMNLNIGQFKVSEIFENIENNMILENAILNLDIKNKDKIFEGDKNKIKEMISEFIENSIRHNEKNLQIKINSFDKLNPYINKIKHKGKFLHIIFRDDGKGIEKDKKEWIFLPTKTTSKIGSGLGLYIIKKTLGYMDGFIFEDGYKGVKFNIFIPYQK